MEYRSLGRTGVMVSAFCLGSTNFGDPTSAEESIRIINCALGAGINFIDTANSYNGGEAERIIGRALKEDGRRDQVVLATKVHNPVGKGPNERGGSRFHIIQACEDSLRRLQTDRIDLYQLHRSTMSLPQDDSLRAFDDLIHSGKVLYIGCSNHPAWRVMEALAISERDHLARYISEQPPYNLLDRRIENELIPLCQKYGLAVIPWAPLASGVLAGRYPVGEDFPQDSRAVRRGDFIKQRISRQGREVAAKVADMARERGMTAAQLALLWVKDQPGVTAPIIGPRTVEHLEEFLPLLERKLDERDRPLFDSLVHPGTAVADFRNTSGWSKERVGC